MSTKDSIKALLDDAKGILDDAKGQVDALPTGSAPAWPTGVNCLGGTVPSLPSSPAFDLAPYTRMDDELRSGWGAYLGSSVTEETDVTQTHAACVNRGIGGNTYAGILNQMSVYPALHRAGFVILEIGINDAGYTAWADMMDRLDKIYAWLTGPLVVLSLIPQGSGSLSLATMNALNAAMVTKLTGRANCALVDVTTPLQDTDGFMKASYSLDSIREHPNTAGKAIIRARVQAGLAALGIS